MPKKAKANSKKNRRAQVPRPMPRPRRAPTPAAASGTELSKCSSDYAKSLIAPWGPEAPCLPQGFPLPSMKRKVFIRGTFAQGASVGFVSFNPTSAISNNTDCLRKTTSAFVGPNVADVLAADVLAAASNSPYTASSFGATSLRLRMVTAGLRVRYSGTSQNLSGRLIAFEHPNHGSVVGLNESTLLSMQGVQTVRPSDKWVCALWSGPKDETELGYENGFANANSCLVIYVSGAVASSVFEFEAYANFEIIGVGASGLTTSHHDPVGASLAASAVSQAQAESPHAGTPDFGAKVGALIQKFGTQAVTKTGTYLWDHKGQIASGLGDVVDLAALL